MKKNAFIATAALAAVGLGAGIAQAAPDVTSVEVHRTGRHKVEVVVQAAHGTTLAAPRISATIGSRTRAARAINWVSGAPATDSVQFVARFKHLRLGIGSVAAALIHPGTGTGVRPPRSMHTCVSSPSAHSSPSRMKRCRLRNDVVPTPPALVSMVITSSSSMRWMNRHWLLTMGIPTPSSSSRVNGQPRSATHSHRPRSIHA